MKHMKKKTLLDQIETWWQEVHLREKITITMWMYPKDKLNEGWSLHDLYERTKAAEQLGYDVQLVATDQGLSVCYKKKIPNIP